MGNEEFSMKLTKTENNINIEFNLEEFHKLQSLLAESNEDYFKYMYLYLFKTNCGFDMRDVDKSLENPSAFLQRGLV